jgi:uncharacterized protein YxjI
MSGVAAIGLEHCAPQPTVLAMKEKLWSLSGDSFKILNAHSGDVAFQIKGKAISLREKKHLLDANGNEIACFQSKLLALHKTFRVYIPSNEEEVMEIKNKVAFVKSKMEASFKNLGDNGKLMKIEAVGDWRDKNVVISEKGGRELATITRKFNMKNVFLDAQTYFLNIHAGVDKAMVVLLALAFDELENDR